MLTDATRVSPSGTTAARTTLPKARTGIRGLDEITGGGLPRGRPTLVCGSAGCGKTLMAMEFLVRGATEFDEPGVFIAFEETPEELTENVRSLGFDLDELVASNRLALDYIHIDRGDIEEAGEYDLEGLFVRLGMAIDAVGAKRVVLDTLETLFGGLSDEGMLRAEIRRLFRWLKDRGVTCVITGERGDGALTRQGLEEYVSDCVILLDHRVSEQSSTRRLRIVKYRGSTHGTNEYSFLIDDTGISVLPVTSLGLDHQVSSERVSSGIPVLDEMLGGRGFYRGSSILVSGTAGTGKTTLAAQFANSVCASGERCLYLSFEESRGQIVRNMGTVGIDLQPWLDRGLLRLSASRPTLYGVEMHLVAIHKLIHDFKPAAVVIDPISNLSMSMNHLETHAMLLRLIDFLKSNQITAMLVNLSSGGQASEGTDQRVSSLIDTWLLLRTVENDNARNKYLYVLKSRGMPHSRSMRKFEITSSGIVIEPAGTPETGATERAD